MALVGLGDASPSILKARAKVMEAMAKAEASTESMPLRCRVLIRQFMDDPNLWPLSS